MLTLNKPTLAVFVVHGTVFLRVTVTIVPANLDQCGSSSSRSLFYRKPGYLGSNGKALLLILLRIQIPHTLKFDVGSVHVDGGVSERPTSDCRCTRLKA